MARDTGLLSFFTSKTSSGLRPDGSPARAVTVSSSRNNAVINAASRRLFSVVGDRKHFRGFISASVGLAPGDVNDCLGRRGWVARRARRGQTMTMKWSFWPLTPALPVGRGEGEFVAAGLEIHATRL